MKFNNKSKNIIKLDDVIFVLVSLFPITTILQGLPLFNNINKFIMAIILGCLFLKIVKLRIRTSTFIVLVVIAFLYLFALYYTNEHLDNFNDLFYFGFWGLYFLYMKNNYCIFEKKICDNKKFLLKIVIIWNIIVFISLFFSSSYTHNWGEANYFRSFSNGEHRFASSCLFIISICWILSQLHKSKKYFVFAILPIISIYLSGTRTYLGVLIILLTCIYYLMCKNKINFFITIIPILILLIFVITLTPMGEKFQNTNQDGYFGYLGTLTNGRSVFWSKDLEEFYKLPLHKKIVGNGFNFIYDINEKAIGARIWAHNDYINILANFGIMGGLIYLYVFINFSNNVLKTRNIHPLLRFGYYLVYFINAMFNMVYVYTCSTLALPFILYSIVYQSKRKNTVSINKKN